MIQWTEIAGQFARNSSDLPIDEQVWNFLSDLPEDRTVLVACSGGADSVLLFFLLLARLPQALKRLCVCHFNHGIRGGDADADARFVADMADALGVSHTAGKAPAGLPATEAALRRARYDWLAKVYMESDSGALCLGHHADDVLESQLMALLTGTGPSGMAAPLPIKPFSDGHVRLRPLLSWRKKQILECLQRSGIPWREDASNADSGHTRNWFRNELIPLMRERFPRDIHSGSERTRRLMGEAVDAIDSWLVRLGLQADHPGCFPVGTLAGQPRALIRRALLSWWLRHRPEERLESAAVDLLVDTIETGRMGLPVSIGGGRTLVLEQDGVLTLQQEAPGTVPTWSAPICWAWPSGPLYLPGGARLDAERTHWDSSTSSPYRTANPGRSAWMAIEDSVLDVRQWQPGDRYRPLGSPGTRKLQDLFTDAKLKHEQKHQLPVIHRGGAILWVPGFPPQEGTRVAPSDKSALKLTYTP
jgi:tRNA(Ile)-lysidine synthase